MKQGWNCNYCSHFNESFDEVNKHEMECSFNPKNKTCWTCSNYKGDGFWIYGETFTCLKGLDVYQYEDEECEQWE